MNKSYTDILCTTLASQRVVRAAAAATFIKRKGVYVSVCVHGIQSKNITNYGLLFYVIPVNVAPISTNVRVDKTVLSII